uniref:Uncharacterized protein n=1 Tax=Oryza glumipatula TaxID=40148 RepID=A0A0E0AYM0_9ORYZ
MPLAGGDVHLCIAVRPSESRKLGSAPPHRRRCSLAVALADADEGNPLPRGCPATCGPASLGTPGPGSPSGATVLFQNLSDQMRFSSLAQHVPVHKETEHHLPDQKMFCLPQCQEKCLDLSVQKAFQKKFVVGKFRCHKVVGVWQVNKVSKGELVPSKELTLTKPLFIDFKDFFQFSFLCVDIIIVVILHRKGQVAKQCPARRIKRMLLMTEPLFNGSPLQNILSQQERIPTLFIGMQALWTHQAGSWISHGITSQLEHLLRC